MALTCVRDDQQDNSIEIIYPELSLSDTKCAEIFSTEEFNFYIVCTYCNKKFFKLKPFAIHVRGIHQCALKQPSLKKSKIEESIKEDSVDAPPSGAEYIPKIIINKDEDNKMKAPISLDSKDQIDKLLQTDSKTKISKPRIKIVIKKGQITSSKLAQENRNTNVKYKQVKYINCGFGNCKQMFPNHNDLTKHKNEIHSTDPNRPYQCKDCNKTFIRTSNLYNHVRSIHLRERNFKCDYCDKRFFERSGKRKHELIHTGEKPCICEKCGEGFPVIHKLNYHIKSKHETAQLECNDCHKLFHNRENLKLHMICHRTDLPYSCYICSKRFSRKRSLDKHLTTHATDRDFICRLCGKDFTSQLRISYHMKTHGLHYMESNVLRKSRQEKYIPSETSK